MGLFNNNGNGNNSNGDSSSFSYNNNNGGKVVGRGMGQAVSSCLSSCCCGDDSTFDGGGGDYDGGSYNNNSNNHHAAAHRRHSDNSHHSDGRFPGDASSNYSSHQQRMSQRGSFNDRSVTGPLTTSWCSELFEYIRIYCCSCSFSTAEERNNGGSGSSSSRFSTTIRTLYRFSRSPTYKILYDFW